MRRINYGFIGAVVLVTVLFSVASPVNLFSAEYNIRFSNTVESTHSWGKAAIMFKEELEKATSGRVTVEPHHLGTLGKTRETMEMVRMGSLEVANGGVAHVQRTVPELGITVLPFLWKDRDRIFQVLDGPLGKDLEKRMAAAGFHNLGFMDMGFRHITNNRKPIFSVDDVKGLKIRTLPTPVHMVFFKKLGASPTPMDWVETVEALKSGVVDAQENPPATIVNSKLYEIQKFYSLTSHVNEVGTMVMSKIFYNKLPKELQATIDATARKVLLWQREEQERDNQNYIVKLEQLGMKINKLTDAEMAKFRKIALEVYPEAVKGFGKDGKELTDRFVAANK